MQLLFQLGIYVPAEEVCISPVDAIFTHFASSQEYNNKMGGFEEECIKLKLYLTVLLETVWFY